MGRNLLPDMDQRQGLVNLTLIRQDLLDIQIKAEVGHPHLTLRQEFVEYQMLQPT